MKSGNPPDNPKNPEEPLSEAELLDNGRGSAGAEPYPKTRRTFSKLAVELETKDLTQAGVQKMILGEISRLEAEVVQMEEYEDAFHRVDKECAILKARHNRSIANEVLYSAGLSTGSAIMGLLPSVGETFLKVGFGALAIALIALAIIAKWQGSKA